MRIKLYLLGLTALLFAEPLSAQLGKDPFAHTLSIVAIDPATGDMGIAVQSHWFAVGNTVAWGEAGVGVIATQAVANIDFGPQGLRMLKSGMLPRDVLDSLLKNDPEKDIRQVAILDKNGNSVVYTGKGCVSEAGHHQGKYYSTQANMVKDSRVWEGMAQAYENNKGSFGERLIAALSAEAAAAGDMRGRQSASLLIVRAKATGKPWIDRSVDLRVDDHENPVQELGRLFRIHTAYGKMNMAYYAMAKGDLSAADSYIEEAQKMYPENRELSFWYAVELANMGELNRVLAIFRETFRVDPKWKTIILPRIYKAGVLKVKQEEYDKINAL